MGLINWIFLYPNRVQQLVTSALNHTMTVSERLSSLLSVSRTSLPKSLKDTTSLKSKLGKS